MVNSFLERLMQVDDVCVCVRVVNAYFPRFAVLLLQQRIRRKSSYESVAVKNRPQSLYVY